MMRRRLSWLALALALAGCTAGPDYHLPETAVINRPSAAGTFVGGKEAAFADAALPALWWRLYRNPQLDGYVGEALAANSDLRIAEANLARADAIVTEGYAERTVSTTIGGGAALARPEETGRALPGRVGYDAGLSLSYPIDLSGRIRRAIEAAEADAGQAAAARDEVRVAIAAEVARSFAAACSANLTLAAYERVLGLQRQTLEATRRLARGGRGTAFDVTRAQAAVDQSAAALPAIIATRAAALYRLAALMGRAPADYPRAVETCRTPPALDRPLPIGDGAALLRRRPDVRAAERGLAAATAGVGVAMAELYPQVSLGGSAGFTGPVGGFDASRAFHIGLGPLISWTFPNRRIARARIAEARADSAAALARFDGTVLEALRDTETALSAYAREGERNAALDRARTSAAEAADQAERLYRFGRADFLALLTAQAALATAEAGLAQSDAALIDHQVDVFRALGGGWQPADSVAAPVP